MSDATAIARGNRLGDERWQQLKEKIVTTKGSAWFENDENQGRKVWAICQEEQIGTRMRRKLVPYNFPAVLEYGDVFIEENEKEEEANENDEEEGLEDKHVDDEDAEVKIRLSMEVHADFFLRRKIKVGMVKM